MSQTAAIRIEDVEAALPRIGGQASMPNNDTVRIQELALSAASMGGVGISVPSSSGSGRYVVRFAGRPNPASDACLWTCECPSRRTCKHIARVADAVDAIGDALGYE